MLEIKLDLFEPVFTHEFVVVFFVQSQVTPVDNGVDKAVWVGLEVATSGNTSDTLEAEGIPMYTVSSRLVEKLLNEKHAKYYKPVSEYPKGKR